MPEARDCSNCKHADKRGTEPPCFQCTALNETTYEGNKWEPKDGGR